MLIVENSWNSLRKHQRYYVVTKRNGFGWLLERELQLPVWMHFRNIKELQANILGFTGVPTTSFKSRPENLSMLAVFDVLMFFESFSVYSVYGCGSLVFW